jgi:hypothetical protein
MHGFSERTACGQRLVQAVRPVGRRTDREEKEMRARIRRAASMGLQRINKPHTRARRRCTLHVGTELRYDVRRGRQETSAADRAPAGA